MHAIWNWMIPSGAACCVVLSVISYGALLQCTETRRDLRYARTRPLRRGGQ